MSLADLTIGPRLFSLKNPARGLEFLLVVDNHAHRISAPKTDTGMKEAWRGTPQPFFLIDETLAYLDSSSNAMGPVVLRHPTTRAPAPGATSNSSNTTLRNWVNSRGGAPNRQRHAYDCGGYQFIGTPWPELTAMEA